MASLHFGDQFLKLDMCTYTPTKVSRWYWESKYPYQSINAGPKYFRLPQDRLHKSTMLMEKIEKFVQYLTHV